MSDDQITIEQLEETTGVTRRNVRFLISEGVVPEPYGQKRWARYGPEHVNALLIYAEMKKAGVSSLDIIRNRILNSAKGSPPLVVNKLDGIEIKIERETLERVGLEDLIKDIVEAIRHEATRKGNDHEIV